MDTIVLTGLSGRNYRYIIYDPSITTWYFIPGNYAFAYKGSDCLWRIGYIGEAESTGRRFRDHERWDDAVRWGATHVFGHSNWMGEFLRQDEERDLIRRYNPPLNTQHRSDNLLSGLAGWRPGLMNLG